MADEDLDLIFRKVVVGRGGRRSLNRIAAVRAAQATPAGPPRARTASPHEAVCTFCIEEAHLKHERRMMHIIGCEATSRSELREAEVYDFDALRQAYKRDSYDLLTAARREKERNAEDGPVKVSAQDRRAMKELEVQEQGSRRLIAMEAAASFDDVAAFCRLTTRQHQQATEVRARSEKRQTSDTADRTRREDSASRRRQEEQFIRSSMQLEDEERRRRGTIVDMEAAVISRVLEVGLAHRRDIRQHEARVEAMMQKHHQRHEQLDLELARIIQDESLNRDRHISAERKAFESTVCMEPDLRKRATTLTRSRLAKEGQDRKDLEAQEQTARGGVWSKFQDSLAQLEADRQSDAVDANVREADRKLRERRSTKEDACAAIERDAMLEEDNLIWAAMQRAIEREAEVPVIEDEESGERALLYETLCCLKALTHALNEERDLVERIATRRANELYEEFRLDVRSEALEADVPSTMLLDFEAVEGAIEIEAAEAEAYGEIEAASKNSLQAAQLAASHPITSSGDDNSVPFKLRCAEPLGVVACNGVIDIASQVELSDELARQNPGPRIVVSLENRIDGDFLQLGEVRTTASSLEFEGAGPDPVCFGTSCSPVCTAPTRVVKVTCDDYSAFLHVTVVPAPVPTVPSLPPTGRRGVCESRGFPLSGFVLPSYLTTSSKLVSLSLTAVSPVALSIQVSEPYTKTKTAVQLNGKPLCKVPKVAGGTTLEFDIDSSKAHDVAGFLAASVVAACDDIRSAAAPITLGLTSKDKNGDVLGTLSQTLPSFVDVPIAQLAMGAPEVFVRTPAVTHAAKNHTKLPTWPNYWLNPKVTILAGEQRGMVYRAVGGRLEVAASLCTIDISPMLPETALTEADGFSIDRESGILSLQRPATAYGVTPPKLDVGFVTGLDTSTLTVAFTPDAAHSACLTAAELTSLLQCFSAAPTTSPDIVQPVQGTVKFTIDCDDVRRPIEATCRLEVLPSLLRPVAKTGIPPITFTEGGKPKPLPSLTEIPAPKGGFGLGAQLRLRVIEGFESDELIVHDEVADNRTGISTFRHKGSTVGSWQSVDLADGLRIHVSGAAGLVPTRVGESKAASDKSSVSSSASHVFTMVEEVPAYAPYTFESWAERSTVTAQSLNILLRSLAFHHDSANPTITKKTLLISLDDGKTGRSSLIMDVNIEAVDDPTEMEFTSREITFAQNSQRAVGGCPVMPGVKLEDPDSDNFHKGFISVEITGGAQQGDHLGLMTPDQQSAEFGNDGQGLLPSLSRVLRSTTEDTAMPTLTALPLLVQQQTADILRLYQDRLFYRGEQIAVVTSRSTPAPSVTDATEPCRTLIRLDFFCDSKFVDFDTATRVLRCITFENRMPKVKSGVRQVSVKLTAGTEITTEKLTVNVRPAVLHQGTPSAASPKVDEVNKVKVLLPNALAFIEGEGIQHQGFWHASIDRPHTGDELLFDSNANIKVKEKSVYFGKDLVGVVQQPRPSLAELYLIFGKVTSESLTALARSFAFVNRGSSLTPGRRRVKLRVAGADELHAATLECFIDVVPKGVPQPQLSFASVANNQTPLSIVQSSAHAAPMCRPLRLAGATIAPPKGSSEFPAGTWIRVQLGRQPLVEAQHLYAASFQPPAEEGDVSQAAVDVKFDSAADPVSHRLSIVRGPDTLAFITPNGFNRDDRFAAANAIDFIAAKPLNAEAMSALLRTVCYDHRLRGVRGRDVQTLLIVVRVGSGTVDPQWVDDRSPVTAEFAHLEGTSVATLPLEVLPPLVDTSGLPRQVLFPEHSLDPVPLFPGVRANVMPSDANATIDVEVVLRDMQPADTLELDFEAAPGDLLVDEDGAIRSSLFAAPSGSAGEADGAARKASMAGGGASAAKSFRVRKMPIARQWRGTLAEKPPDAPPPTTSSPKKGGAAAAAAPAPAPTDADDPPSRPVVQAYSAEFKMTDTAEGAASAWVQAVHARAVGGSAPEGRSFTATLRVVTSYATAEETVTVRVAPSSSSISFGAA